MVTVNSESHCFIKIDYIIFKSMLQSGNDPKPISNNNNKTKLNKNQAKNKERERERRKEKKICFVEGSFISQFCFICTIVQKK